MPMSSPPDEPPQPPTQREAVTPFASIAIAIILAVRQKVNVDGELYHHQSHVVMKLSAIFLQ